MSIFAISDKLSLESTGGISLPESALLRGFMQEGVMAIAASLTQLRIELIVSSQRSSSRYSNRRRLTSNI
jgi:hypothetical protein